MRALFVFPVPRVITGARASPPAAAPTAPPLRTVRFMAGYKPQANLPFDQWQAFHDSLLRFGGVSATVQVDTAFSDLILQRIYADSRSQWS